MGIEENTRINRVVGRVGRKTFCGDVRDIIEAQKKSETLGEKKFKLEYAINGVIVSYRILYIALIDVIVMAGGVGLSVHGRYRISTGKTLFAMLETQIRFFPELGLYLALTGQRLKGSDVLKAGIATHLCESKNLSTLEQALMSCRRSGDIEVALKKFVQNNLPEFCLEPFSPRLYKYFSSSTMEEVVSNLEKDSYSWAKDTFALLNVLDELEGCIEAVGEEKNMSLKDCLDLEYTMASNFLKNKEFAEGELQIVENFIKWKGGIKECLIMIHDDKTSTRIEKRIIKKRNKF